MADKLTGAQGAADASQVDAAAGENQSFRDLFRKLDEGLEVISKCRREWLTETCATLLDRQEAMANHLLVMYKLIRALITPGAVAAGAGGSRGAGSAEQEAGGGSNSLATITRICATFLEREETTANHLSLMYKLMQELIPGEVAAGAGGNRGAGSAEQEAGGGSNSPGTITKKILWCCVQPLRKRQRGVELK